MTRLLHLITGLGLGGAEMTLCKLVRRLPTSRYAIDVVTLARAGRLASALTEHGARVWSLGLGGDLASARRLYELRRLIGALKPDVLHSWLYHANVAACISRRRDRKSLVWSVRHSLDDLAGETRSARVVIHAGAFLSRIPARIIYCSETAARQHERVGYSSRKTVVIPNGFDCARFRPDPIARRNVRASLGLGDGILAIGNVGRYHPVKNHVGLLEAFACLRERHQDARLLLAGPEMTAENASLVRIIQRRGLENEVLLLGPWRDVPSLMSALDLYVSASHAEAFPNVVAEAMACGVPCVATDVGDTRAIVGDTGRLVEPRDGAGGLARAMEALVDLPPQEARRRGEAARKRIVDRYDLAFFASQYERLYENMARP